MHINWMTSTLIYNWTVYMHGASLEPQAPYESKHLHTSVTGKESFTVSSFPKAPSQPKFPHTSVTRKGSIIGIFLPICTCAWMARLPIIEYRITFILHPPLSVSQHKAIGTSNLVTIQACSQAPRRREVILICQWTLTKYRSQFSACASSFHPR